MIVVVEGPDGSGKSTLADALAELFNGTVKKTSLSESFLPEAKKIFDSIAYDVPLARYVYYTAAAAYAARPEFKAETDDSVVIFDRYIYSGVATHTALETLRSGGKYVPVIDAIYNEVKERFAKPDAVIFLFIDERDRLARLQRRDDATNIKLDFDRDFASITQEKFRKIAMELKKDGIPVLEINASANGTDQVRLQAKKFIASLKREKQKICCDQYASK